MQYIVFLSLLIALYVFVIRHMDRMKNTGLWNLAFSLPIFPLYITLVLIVYGDVGFNDWNFQNTLPVANVSPFMFSIIPLIYILPRKIKKHFYLLISLLSVGMIFSTALGCIYNASIDYAFHFHFTLDYFAHFLLSLWGVYLVKSGQVELKPRKVLVSSSIILGVATQMLLLNMIFDTSFFGLSLNGKHNIYNNVVTDNSYLSCALYFVGLICVLLLGLLYSRIMSKKPIK